jgi:hypothetical protein
VQVEGIAGGLPETPFDVTLIVIGPRYQLEKKFTTVFWRQRL